MGARRLRARLVLERLAMVDDVESELRVEREMAWHREFEAWLARLIARREESENA